MKRYNQFNLKPAFHIYFLIPFALIMIFCLGSTELLAKEPGKVLVAYYSKTGFTRQMALAVVEGVKKVPGVQVKLLTVKEAKIADVFWAEGIIIGSPVYNANIAIPVQQFINSWPFQDAPLRDKVGAAFVTGGGISAGEELVQLNILRTMLMYGMIVIGGKDWQSVFGASAVTEEKPFDQFFKAKIVAPQFLKKARDLGQRVATLVLKFK
jgi:NAD(P)H dehydrogenase (quinone)